MTIAGLMVCFIIQAQVRGATKSSMARKTRLSFSLPPTVFPGTYLKSMVAKALPTTNVDGLN